MPYKGEGVFDPPRYTVDPRAWNNLHRIAQYMIQHRHLSKDSPARASDIAKGTGISRPQVAKLLKDRVGFTKIDSTDTVTYGYYYWPEFRQASLNEGNAGYPKQVRLLSFCEHPIRYVFSPDLSDSEEVSPASAPGVIRGTKWAAVEGVPDEILANLWAKGEVTVLWGGEHRDSLNSVIQQLITLAEWADNNGH